MLNIKGYIFLVRTVILTFPVHELSALDWSEKWFLTCSSFSIWSIWMKLHRYVISDIFTQISDSSIGLLVWWNFEQYLQDILFVISDIFTQIPNSNALLVWQKFEQYLQDIIFVISDIFTQISDSSGLLVRQKFEQYLQDILALPTAVFEGPSFGYNDTAVRACFDMVTYFYIKDIQHECSAVYSPMFGGIDQVRNELCYKGTILQRNYRKMTILWSFSLDSFVEFHGNFFSAATANSYIEILCYSKLCYEERGGSVVECLTRDRGVMGWSLTRGTALSTWARHYKIILCLVLVQPMKTRREITEKLLTWT